MDNTAEMVNINQPMLGINISENIDRRDSVHFHNIVNIVNIRNILYIIDRH